METIVSSYVALYSVYTMGGEKALALLLQVSAVLQYTLNKKFMFTAQEAEISERLWIQVETYQK